MNKNNTDGLRLLKLKIVFEWIKNSHDVKYYETETDVDYVDISTIKVKVPLVDGAKSIRIKIYLESDLICDMEQSVAKSELIK